MGLKELRRHAMHWFQPAAVICTGCTYINILGPERTQDQKCFFRFPKKGAEISTLNNVNALEIVCM